MPVGSEIGLRLLGPLRLEGIDRRRELALLAGDKRIALFVYLAVAGRGDYIRRDTLLALLWPEADEAHARGALRALVYQLRQAVPADILRTRSDQALAIDLQRVRCDLFEFEQACAAGDWEAAVALNRGELLEGFGLAGAPAFEDWLSAERNRVRRLAGDLAWREAARAGALADHRREIVALRHLLLSTPYDESAARSLMQAFERAGDRAGALRFFNDFAAGLRKDLDASPTPDTLALAATLREPTPVVPAGRRPAKDAEPVSRPPLATGTRSRSPVRVVPAIAVLLVVGSVTMSIGFRQWARVTLDPGIIAVLPFDAVDGDSAARRLGRALPALIGERLNFEAGPVTADLGDVRRAATDHASRNGETIASDAVSVARAVGAGKAIFGVVATHPTGITVTATILDVAAGRTRGQTSITEPLDSLPHRLDRLVGLLLSRDAGEPEDRLPLLSQEPLPALLWYLKGQAFRRSGQGDQALDSYIRALEVDSAFATAALAASLAAGAGGGPWVRRGLELAWRRRDGLTPLDRAVLLAKLGPRYPRASSLAEQLAAWEALVPGTGGRPEQYEVLYSYGDQLFHFGPLLGIPDAHERATVAFERASRLDPAPDGALRHLAEMAFIQRDTARLRLAVTRLLQRNDADTARWVAQWMLARAPAGGGWPDGVPDGLDQAPLYNLPLQAGVALEDAERVVRLWRREATTPRAVIGQFRMMWDLALNQGRPGLAMILLDSAVAMARSSDLLTDLADELDRIKVRAVLYWDADPASAREALFRIRNRAARTAPRDSVAWARWVQDRCVVDEWQVWRDADADAVRRSTVPEGTDSTGNGCWAIIRTLAAVLEGAPDATRRLDALDALARTGPPRWTTGLVHGNLVIARLHERMGRVDRAYQAVRRRGVYFVEFNQYLSTYLREEGRLALAVGDTAGAVRAWRHYLGLRSDPEPVLAGERGRIAGQWADLAGTAGMPQ